MAARARALARSSTVPKPRPWTRADLARLPDDGNRYEVLDGCLLVTPQASYGHQRVAMLLVEVLSASTRDRDFGIKLDAYLDRVRVPVVWIVDRWERTVHVCERGASGTKPRVESKTLQWHAPGAPESLQIDLPTFFKDALGA